MIIFRIFKVFYFSFTIFVFVTRKKSDSKIETKKKRKLWKRKRKNETWWNYENKSMKRNEIKIFVIKIGWIKQCKKVLFSNRKKERPATSTQNRLITDVIESTSPHRFVEMKSIFKVSTAHHRFRHSRVFKWHAKWKRLGKMEKDRELQMTGRGRDRELLCRDDVLFSAVRISLYREASG